MLKYYSFYEYRIRLITKYFKYMKKKLILFNLVVMAGLIGSGALRGADDPKTLDIGAAAPAFSLPGVDGKTYTLNNFKAGKILVIIFTANHCPTAQAYEDRIMQLYQDYHSKGVEFVMISPNNPQAVCLEEIGYSDLGDSFEEMKIRAKDKKYTMPYLLRR